MPYLTLFGWSFLAATLVPVGSEPALVYLVRQGLPVPALVAVATLGNYLGACTTYAIARTAFTAWRKRHAAARPDDRATRIVQRYGSIALLFSWVPILGDAIVAAAGVARLPFHWFSLWTIIGKFVRYVVVAAGAAAW